MNDTFGVCSAPAGCSDTRLQAGAVYGDNSTADTTPRLEGACGDVKWVFCQVVQDILSRTCNSAGLSKIAMWMIFDASAMRWSRRAYPPPGPFLDARPGSSYPRDRACH